MRRILVTASLIVGTAFAIGTPAGAIVPATNFHFTGPVRVFDSRNPGSALTSGTAVALNFPSLPLGSRRAIVNTFVTAATQPTKLYFHPCSQMPDLSIRSANFGELGTQEDNLVPIDLVAQPCMTLVGNGEVIVDLIGYEDNTQGLNYVAQAQPIELVGSKVGSLYRFAANDLPAGAQATAVWVGVQAPDSQPAAVQLASCDGSASDQFWPSVTAPADRFADNLFIAPLTATKEVCFRTLGGFEPASISILRFGYLAPNVTATAVGLPYGGFIDQTAPGFVPLSPQRIFDTRESFGPIGDRGVIKYSFTNLPAGATAVAMNITATQTSGPGFISAYPCDGDQPLVSNLNYGADQTVPNFAIVSLGSTAEICFYTLRSTHLLADLAGYFLFDGGDGYVPTVPKRVFDTRDIAAPIAAPIAARGVFVQDFTSYVGADATSVVINLTVTQPVGSGFITAYPCGTAPPTVSNLNYSNDQTVPNLVTVKLPPDKRVCFFALTRAHLLADLAGWYAPSSNLGFIDELPYRLFDTREPAGSDPFESREEYGFTIGDASIKALAWNLTVTQTSSSGFLTVYPCSLGLPLASNVNYTGVNHTIANFAIVTPDSTTDVCFYALATTHVIADEAGIFVTPYVAVTYYEGAPPP